MKHLMIDLETRATKPGAAIVSIGAVVFTDEDILRTFYVELDWRAQLKLGLVEDTDTVAWWERQSSVAREVLECRSTTQSLLTGLLWFVEFASKHDFDGVWCKGASFDFPILERAVDVVNDASVVLPWHYSKERCARTVFALAGVKIDFDAMTPHVAVNDAIAQAKAVQRAWHRLGVIHAEGGVV